MTVDVREQQHLMTLFTIRCVNRQNFRRYEKKLNAHFFMWVYGRKFRDGISFSKKQKSPTFILLKKLILYVFRLSSNE